MIREVLESTGWLALLGAGALAACSSPPPTADAFVYATVGANGSSTATCNLGATEVFSAIGTMSAGTLPTTETDGNSNSTITCSVTQSGSGFQIALYAHGSAGTFVLDGMVDAQGGTGLTASFDSLAYGSFRAKGCTVTYTYQSMPVPASAPVGAGQIFGHVDCPDTELTGQEIDTDAGAVAVTCDGEADFLFQNCTK